MLVAGGRRPWADAPSVRPQNGIEKEGSDGGLAFVSVWDARHRRVPSIAGACPAVWRGGWLVWGTVLLSLLSLPCPLRVVPLWRAVGGGCWRRSGRVGVWLCVWVGRGGCGRRLGDVPGYGGARAWVRCLLVPRCFFSVPCGAHTPETHSMGSYGRSRTLRGWSLGCGGMGALAGVCRGTRDMHVIRLRLWALGAYAECLCHRLLKGTDVRWRLKWGAPWGVWASCRAAADGSALFRLSPCLAGTPVGWWRHTLCHGMAHALVGSTHAHDRMWESMFRRPAGDTRRLPDTCSPGRRHLLAAGTQEG